MSVTCNKFEALQNHKKDIGVVFRHHRDRLTTVRYIAADISAEVKKLSDVIDQHTAEVCPDCRSVCCTNRHSYHTYDDIVYLYAREEKIPSHTVAPASSAPCQFLGKMGCSLPRDLRPYRCNWYFCSPLLDHIVAHNSCRHYRFFISLLEQITGKRQKMMQEYASARRGMLLEKNG